MPAILDGQTVVVDACGIEDSRGSSRLPERTGSESPSPETVYRERGDHRLLKRQRDVEEGGSCSRVPFSSSAPFAGEKETHTITPASRTIMRFIDFSFAAILLPLQVPNAAEGRNQTRLTASEGACVPLELRRPCAAGRSRLRLAVKRFTDLMLTMLSVATKWRRPTNHRSKPC